MESKENRPKQVIVMRTDLNMRKGKMISQGSHASFKAFLDLCVVSEKNDYKIFSFCCKLDSAWDDWLSEKFTKVVCACGSEKELLDLYQQSIDSSIPCSLITDAGFTEFHNVPTNTCIAIGPDFPEKVDKITGNLKLL